MIPPARNFLTRPPTGRYFSPALPSDCFAIDFPRRAISPSEGLPILHTSLKGSGQGCPQLRASNEHSFIVRVLRARRAPGCSLPTLLRARVPRAGGRPGCPSPLCYGSNGSALVSFRSAFWVRTIFIVAGRAV